MLQTGELANDCGTVLVGEETVNRGIIDAVGTLADAIDKAKSLADI